MNWATANKLRIHNKNETMKHFLIKAILMKILFNKGYVVYTEYEVRNPDLKENRVADVFAVNYRFKKNNKIFIEVETKKSDCKFEKLSEFYKDYVFYIVHPRELPNDLLELEEQIKHILGF